MFWVKSTKWTTCTIYVNKKYDIVDQVRPAKVQEIQGYLNVLKSHLKLVT